MITLYHYTSAERLPAILRSGKLTRTESNLHPVKEHHGPDCVWFTTDSELTEDHGLGGSFYDKKRIRITVELPRSWVRNWRSWALSKKIDPTWLNGLAKVGGIGTWRVTFRDIGDEYITSITDMQTGKELWPLATKTSPGGSIKASRTSKPT